MITLKHIHKSYLSESKEKVFALNDINLHIESGDIFGVIGESGAGKSTLIRCVNLLERPDRGEVIVNQQNLLRLNKKELLQARQQIGMIFQHFNLMSNKTVYKNIAFPLELKKTSPSVIKEKVNALLQLIGLTDKANAYPAQLSGGQKQRVAIARALVSDTKLLLCDEATSALDPKTTDSILSLLKEINEKLGVTILLITHEMDVIKKICHKVALLDQGKLIETQTVSQFFTHPQSKLGRKLITQIEDISLPDVYQNKLQPTGNFPIIKFNFQNDHVNSPTLSTLAKQFDLDINIVQAKIEQIENNTLGVLIAEIQGDSEKINNALIWLNNSPVQTEVLGYVN